MKTESVRTICMGHITSGPLFKRRTFKVVGTTSRGIYLQPEDELTIFLSGESFRGPLTLNLEGGPDNLPTLQPGDILTRIDDELVLETGNLSINIKSPSFWKPSESPAGKKLSGFRRNRVLKKAAAYLGDHPHLPLLDIAASGSSGPLNILPELADRATALADALGTGDPDRILSGMQVLLGAGPGLTPLGDDLLLGTVLAIKRSGKYKASIAHIRAEAGMHLALLNEAREKTTTLSWSLLYCAALGSADERIIRVLDHLIAGRRVPKQELVALLEWGSSSGIGVLAGMMIVLSR